MRFPLLVVGLLVLVLTEATSAQTGNVSRYTLPNGLRLLVREDSSAGVVAVSLQSRAGSRLGGAGPDNRTTRTNDEAIYIKCGPLPKAT